MIRRWLEHPLTRGRDLDDPETTGLRRQVLDRKPFLRAVYRDWYGALVGALPPGPGRLLELGAGAGFLDQLLPGLVRSEVFACPWVDAVCDGMALPFAPGSLRGIVMTNVLHHLPQPGRFFVEAARCVRPGGVVAMVEPWNTTWSRWVYRHLHHETFLPAAAEWEAPPGGPLSVANGALPWILFARDRARFAAEHPAWRLLSLEPQMPLRYLLAGGISLRALAPAATYRFWRGLERALHPLRHRLAMFATIVLERTALND